MQRYFFYNVENTGFDDMLKTPATTEFSVILDNVGEQFVPDGIAAGDAGEHDVLLYQQIKYKINVLADEYREKRFFRRW